MMSNQRLSQIIRTPTTKLAATYLAIIMLMSIGFSIIFYSTSARQFDRPLPPSGQITPTMDSLSSRPFDMQVREAVEERFKQAREELLVRLIWINLCALLGGSVISYGLARRSLRPIEEAMEAQTQFVSDASHELRTPLTLLQTSNEVALRKKKLNEKDMRELLAHNVEDVIKLRNLSDSLLNLLKNTDKDVELFPLNLQDIVTESLQQVVKIAQQRNISVEENVPSLYVQSNEFLLSQILSVLLDNAVKYSEENKTIKITAKRLDGKAYLEVIDEGIGIKASDIPHIFRRFYRADKARSGVESGGYGLGLSIADKLAKQLGAKLKVDSKVGKGTTFTVIMPVANKR